MPNYNPPNGIPFFLFGGSENNITILVNVCILIVMNQGDTLVENIKQWVQYDNQLKLLTEKTREVRERRCQLQTSIIDELKAKNMHQTTIGIGTHSELKMVAKKEYPPLTYQYVERCLHEVIPNKEHVEYIIGYLKSHREIKETTDLKRISTKQQT